MPRILIAAAAFGALIAPVAVHAQVCAPFNDVPAADGFCSSIQWMFNRGITVGCAASQYCPSDFVRRDQMAAFMKRLGDRAFLQGGNAFGGQAVLGTTDGFAIEMVVGGTRVLHIDRTDSAYGPDVVNLTAGHPENVVARNCPSIQACLGSDGPVGGSILGGGRVAQPNRVTDSFGTVAGGYANIAGNDNASSSDAMLAFIGGGYLNRASGVFSAIGGGSENTASGFASTVPGGQRNSAVGNYSFAAGYSARSMNQGCFTWADTSAGEFSCAGDNAFVARASGGVYFRTNAEATTGVDLFGGAGAWSLASDRALKERIVSVNPRDVLERLVRMPVATWNYRSQPASIRHMGPMAQDVHAAFGLGESDRHISTVDADGIAFAAIQGLNAKLEARIAEQASEIGELRRAVEVLMARLPAEERVARTR